MIRADGQTKAASAHTRPTQTTASPAGRYHRVRNPDRCLLRVEPGHEPL